MPQGQGLYGSAGSDDLADERATSLAEARTAVEADLVASCDQDGRVRQGGATQEYVLTTAANSVSGERVHEIDALSLPQACANRDGQGSSRQIAAASQA